MYLNSPFLLSTLPASLDREDTAASKRAILIVEFLGERPRGDGENSPPSRSDSGLPIPLQGIWNAVFPQLPLSLLTRPFSRYVDTHVAHRCTCSDPTGARRRTG